MDNTIDYQLKYLKYKKKYLDLKEQNGGNIFRTIKNIFEVRPEIKFTYIYNNNTKSKTINSKTIHAIVELIRNTLYKTRVGTLHEIYNDLLDFTFKYILYNKIPFDLRNIDTTNAVIKESKILNIEGRKEDEDKIETFKKFINIINNNIKITDLDKINENLTKERLPKYIRQIIIEEFNNINIQEVLELEAVRINYCRDLYDKECKDELTGKILRVDEHYNVKSFLNYLNTL